MRQNFQLLILEKKKLKSGEGGVGLLGDRLVVRESSDGERGYMWFLIKQGDLQTWKKPWKNHTSFQLDILSRFLQFFLKNFRNQSCTPGQMYIQCGQEVQVVTKKFLGTLKWGHM